MKPYLAIVTMVLFIISGVSLPLLIELISTNGGCEQSTLLIMLPGSFGSIFCIFTNWSNRFKGKIPWILIIIIASLETFSQLLNLNGLIYAGSALFTVVYSSIVIYTAFFSYIILKRKLNIQQYLGICIVAVGLAIVGIDSRQEGENVALGILMIIVGTISHSLSYIISEYVLVDNYDPIEPELLGSLLGLIGFIVGIIWQMVYTLPRYQEKIINNINIHHGRVDVILIAYFCMIIACILHSLCFYRLLTMVGSTTLGLSKAAQSVIVFVASHYIYCSIQKSQCFTPLKGLSLLTVIIGVVLYSIAFEETIKKHAYIPIEDKVVIELIDINKNILKPTSTTKSNYVM